MQEHLKIRITGAIILVVLVVSLVPEMFRGRTEGRAAHGEASGNELPLHSYTIDLRNNPAPAQTTVAAPIPDPAIRAPAAAVPAAPPPQPAPLPAPAHSGGRWVVQVGTFSRRDFAERMVKQLHAAGLAVVAVGPDDHGLYRVRSAALSTRASAEALRQKMVLKGLKPIVNSAP